LSVDHSAPVPIKEGDALFLSVKAGMTVIVKHLPGTGQPDQPESWWMADVIVFEGGWCPEPQGADPLSSGRCGFSCCPLG
jgi:hypothetical protein